MLKHSRNDLHYIVCRPTLCAEMLALSGRKSALDEIEVDPKSLTEFDDSIAWMPTPRGGGIVVTTTSASRRLVKPFRGGIDTSFSALDRTGNPEDETGFSYWNHVLRLSPIMSPFGPRKDNKVDRLRVTPEHVDGWNTAPEVILEFSRKIPDTLTTDEVMGLLAHYGIDTEDMSSAEWPRGLTDLHLKRPGTMRVALLDEMIPIEPVLAAAAMCAFVVCETHRSLRAAHVIGDLEGRIQCRPIWFMSR